MPKLYPNARRRLWLATGSAAIAVMSAAPGFAQEASEVDELVVTARKREENLKDVPVSVSAFSQQALQDRLVTDIPAVADFTPGLQVQPAFGRDGDRPVIRGGAAILIAEGKVGIFVDGIPYFGDFSALDVENAARVEIIKGPQSAVFGRGTETGAINVVTRRPSATDVNAQIKLTAGSDDRIEVSGFLSGPLFAGLTAIIGGKSLDVDGQYLNAVNPGEKLGAQSSRQIYGALYWDPVKDFSASVRYMYNEDNDNHFPVALLPGTAANCFLGTRPYFCGTAPSPGRIALNTQDILRPGLYREAERIMGQASWDIMGSGYEVSYQGGYSEIDETSGYDQSYDDRTIFQVAAICALPFFTTANRTCSRSAFGDTSASHREITSNEVRLSSPGDSRLRWRVGAYYGEEKSTPPALYLESTEFGLDTLGARTNVENKAIFGGLDFDLLDTLTLGLEYRHQEDEIVQTQQCYVASTHFQAAQFATFRSANPAAIVGTCPTVANTRAATFKNNLPRATLTWKVRPDVTLYGQYAKGNSPGGFNDILAPLTTYDEETLETFEIGAKTTGFGFDYLAVSLYFNKINGMVLTNTFLNPTTGAPNSFRANAGDVETKGLEIEGYRELFEGFRIQASYSYIDAEFVRGVDPDQAVLIAPTVPVGATTTSACKTGTTANLLLPGCAAFGSIVGKTTPLTSKHMVSVGLRYEAATAWTDWSWFAGGDLIYRSSFFDQVHNLAETGGATKVNLQVGLKTDNGFRATLYGRNVFDNDTPVGILRYVDFFAPVGPSGDRRRGFAISPPRKSEWGVTLLKSF